MSNNLQPAVPMQTPMFTQMAPVNLENSFSTTLTTTESTVLGNNTSVIDDSQSSGRVVVQSNGQVFFVNDGNNQQTSDVNESSSTDTAGCPSMSQETTTPQQISVNSSTQQIVSVPGQGNNLPQALLLPNGTVVPVVTQPHLVVDNKPTFFMNQSQQIVKPTQIRLQGQRGKDPQAMITSTGTLVLTLPPGGQPVLDQNGLPLLHGVVPNAAGQVIIRKQPPQKKGQRMIMPKPSVTTSTNSIVTQTIQASNGVLIGGGALVPQQILQSGSVLAPSLGQIITSSSPILQQQNVITTFIPTLSTQTTQSTSTPVVTPSQSEVSYSKKLEKNKKSKGKKLKVSPDDDILAKAAEHIFKSPDVDVNLSPQKEDQVENSETEENEIDYLDMPCLSIVTDVDSSNVAESQATKSSPSPKKEKQKKISTPSPQKKSSLNNDIKPEKEMITNSPTLSKKTKKGKADTMNSVDTLPDTIEFASKDLPSVLDRIENMNTSIVSTSSNERKGIKRASNQSSAPSAKKSKTDLQSSSANSLNNCNLPTSPNSQNNIRNKTSNHKQRTPSRRHNTTPIKKTPKKCSHAMSSDPYTFVDEDEEITGTKEQDSEILNKQDKALEKSPKKSEISSPPKETSNLQEDLQNPTKENTISKTEKSKIVEKEAITEVTPKAHDTSTSEATPDKSSGKKHKEKHKKKKKHKDKEKKHKHKHKSKDKEKSDKEKQKDVKSISEEKTDTIPSYLESFNGPIPNLGTPMPAKITDEPNGLELLNEMPTQDSLVIPDAFADPPRRAIVPPPLAQPSNHYAPSHPPVTSNKQIGETKKSSCNVRSTSSPSKAVAAPLASSKPSPACGIPSSNSLPITKSNPKPSSESGSAMRLTHMETSTSSTKQKQTVAPAAPPFLPQHYGGQYGLSQRGWTHEPIIPTPFSFSLTSAPTTTTHSNFIMPSQQSCSKARSSHSAVQQPSAHRSSASSRDPYTGLNLLDPYENHVAGPPSHTSSRRHGKSSGSASKGHVDTNLGNSIFDQAATLLPPTAHTHSFMGWPSCGLEGTQQSQQVSNQGQEQATAWAAHNMNMFAWQQMTHPSATGASHMSERMAPAFATPFSIPPHTGHFPPHSLS